MRGGLWAIGGVTWVMMASSSACGSSDEPQSPPSVTGTMEGGTPQTGEGGLPPAPAGSFEEVVQAFALAVCKTIYECPQTNDENGGLRIMFTSPADCAQRMRPVWNQDQRVFSRLARLDRLGPLVASGTITIDKAALDECLKGLENCQSNVACDRVAAGSKAEGEACDVNEVCKTGLYCRSPATGGCPGVCAPRVALGQACSSNCELDATCDGSVCVARPIVTPQRVGLDQECDLPNDGPAVRLCQPGLYCQRGAAGLSSTCKPPIAANAPCHATFTDVCVAGHLCLGPSGERTCKPIALGAAGDACAMRMVTPDIRPCNPWAGLACQADGKCGPGGGNAEPVLRIFDEPACFQGFSEGSNDTCEPLRAAGAPCTRDVHCASGTCSGTCRDTYCE